jgi:hypothetical protein
VSVIVIPRWSLLDLAWTRRGALLVQRTPLLRISRGVFADVAWLGLVRPRPFKVRTLFTFSVSSYSTIIQSLPDLTRQHIMSATYMLYFQIGQLMVFFRIASSIYLDPCLALLGSREPNSFGPICARAAACGETTATTEHLRMYLRCHFIQRPEIGPAIGVWSSSPSCAVHSSSLFCLT